MRHLHCRERRPGAGVAGHPLQGRVGLQPLRKQVHEYRSHASARYYRTEWFPTMQAPPWGSGAGGGGGSSACMRGGSTSSHARCRCNLATLRSFRKSSRHTRFERLQTRARITQGHCTCCLAAQLVAAWHAHQPCTARCHHGRRCAWRVGLGALADASRGAQAPTVPSVPPRGV